MYYFETNAIRSLGRTLGNYSFRTSHLSLIEIITGINNEREFSIRKKCLFQIKESNYSIDSLLPEYKLFASFGFNVKRESDEFYQKTQNLIDYLMKVDRFEEVTDDAHFKLLLQYDQNSNNLWSDAILERIKQRKRNTNSKEVVLDFDSL